MKTNSDINEMLSALAVDLLNERITPQIASAVISGASRAFKSLELSHKYGQGKALRLF